MNVLRTYGKSRKLGIPQLEWTGGFFILVRWRIGRRSGDGTPVRNPITGSNPVLTTRENR